jgi:hypothetical protein
MYERLAAGPVSVRRGADEPADCAHEKDLQTQAFWEAAEGIRTLDLLHGKQSVPRRIRMNMPANRQCLGPGAYAGSPKFTAKSRGFPDPNRTEPGTSQSAEVEKAGALGGTGREDAAVP